VKDRAFLLLPLAAAVIFSALLLWWLRGGPVEATRSADGRLPALGVAVRPASGAEAALLADAASILRVVQALANSPDAPALLQAQLAALLGRPGAMPNESVLSFRDAAAYDAFLARAAAAGLDVAGRLDGLLTVRVRFDSLDGLAADLLANSSDYTEVAANVIVLPPPAPPPAEERPGGAQAAVGNRLLDLLGVTGDHSTWGQGVTIAVLDSGVAADPTLADRLRVLDLGQGTAPAADDGHGTAVASIAAGSANDAPGVAPGADLLSIRVTGEDGTSNLFTLAEAIMRATDAGADVINISMAAYADSAYLGNAIGYAIENGAVIVAAAGNDQAAQLSWPAADPRVISVGSVDALGQQDVFSNSGPQLSLTAPGYDVQAAWTDGERVYFTGTSASAPVVAGSIAALLSQNPGMTGEEAAQVLQQYSNDGGTAGADPDYGEGTVNLGWAMNRDNPARVDTAISSHYFNNETGNMEFVVQNRSGAAVSGLTLTVDAGGSTGVATVQALEPGATYTATVPVDKAALTSAGQLTFRTTLANPPGAAADAVPANNRATSSLTAPAAAP
jgi:hypothetical protein